MAEWPREIRPEDRVTYLVNARTEVLNQHHDGEIHVVNGVFSAYRKSLLLGEFDTTDEALKAIRDDMVVESAIRQAWEDLAT